ncbi:MAG: Holo-[acyl-carrier-protein] synthase [Chlamydiia bacterium]|nr:Holo-[acyl-carrier-protein] synthase [Chlamydiia bacterium]
MGSIEIGTDTIEIERVRQLMEKSGDRFLEKICTPSEIAYCKDHRKSPEMRVAGRYAAKEALVKALGCGFGPDIGFLDIEILPNAKGMPIARLSKEANRRFFHPRIRVTISHDQTKAIATAIISWSFLRRIQKFLHRKGH